jgi:ribA/ribD-fused uncharacterized protein
MGVIDSFRGPHDFLSNFHDSTEKIFQAWKTLDIGWQQRILQARSPREAKRLGNLAPLRPDWEEIKLAVMLRCLRVKFAPGSPLASALLDTEPHELIEGNTWHDNFWGACFCPRCGGQGSNWLGRLLMVRRAELQLESAG